MVIKFILIFSVYIALLLNVQLLIHVPYEYDNGESIKFDYNSQEAAEDAILRNNTECVIPTRNIDINSTQSLLQLSGQIAALPKSFGMTEDQGNSSFPHYEYPYCQDIRPDPQGKVTIKRFPYNKLEFKCYNNEIPQVYQGPYDKKTMWTSRENVEGAWPNATTNLERQFNDLEWAVGSCNATANQWDIIDINLNVKEDEAQRAQSIAQSKYNGKSRRPLTIAMIVIDSTSRQHFFRKLPKTVEYMNELHNSNETQFTLFDYQMYNIVGTMTKDNMAYLYAGQSKNWIRKAGKNRRQEDMSAEEAIWNKLKEDGFVSSFAFEGCAPSWANIVGRRPTATNAFQSFYCFMLYIGQYSSFKKLKNTQRCIGPRMAHEYVMDYSKQFADGYPNNNQWIYNHVTTAHESSGLHLQTLDQHLPKFMKDLVKKAEDQQRDLVFFIMADHGMRYGDYQKDTNAIQEHRLPALFIMANDRYLEEFEYSKDILQHNTKRLVTMPDLRATVLAMAKEQYGEQYDSGDKYSLINEKIPASRTCQDASIPESYCASMSLLMLCNKWFEDDMEPENESALKHRKAIEYLLKSSLYIINEHSYASPKRNKGLICQKLTFSEIKSVMISADPGANKVFRIKFKVNQSKAAVLNIVIYLSDTQSLQTPLNEEYNYPPFQIQYQGSKQWVKIQQIYRTDAYAGEWEDRARKFDNLNPELCVCAELNK